MQADCSPYSRLIDSDDIFELLLYRPLSAVPPEVGTGDVLSTQRKEHYV